MIAALDALVLNDREGCESTNDEKRAVKEGGDDSEVVEIVAAGPVPIKPKATSSKGIRKVKSSVQRDIERYVSESYFYVHPINEVIPIT